MLPEKSHPLPGLSAAEAEAQAAGVYNPTTGRTEYPNGGWSMPDGGVDGNTWNMWLPSGSYRGDGTFSLGQVAYGEAVSAYVPEDIHGYNASDSSSMPGIDIELSREIYRNDEDGYGCDLVFSVMYFFQSNMFKSDRGYRAGREAQSRDGGVVESRIDAPDELPDSNDWYWNENGSYGRGGIDTEFNGGPVFDLDTISTVAHPGGSQTGGRDCFGLLSARGDYRQLDLVLSLRPYYDVTEWLRVYGTIGAVLSRDEFELNVTMSDNDLVYRRNSDFSHWNLYGIGGLGAMLRYKDFTLAGDFLARFGDDDLTVDDRFVHGTVEHGRWMFKLTVGYEF